MSTHQETNKLTPEERDSKISVILHPIIKSLFSNRDEADLEPEDREQFHSLKAIYLSNLNAFSDELINGLHEVITGENWTLASELVTLLSHADSEASIHEHLKFRPLMSGACGIAGSRMILQPLHEYAQLPQTENYASCNPIITKQAAALVIVTELLLAESNDLTVLDEDASWLPLTNVRGGVHLSNDALIRITLERPQNAERIAKIIVTRRTTDTNLIRTILTATAPAISDGTL